MVVRDALFGNSRIEPWWFGLIRRVFALIFIVLWTVYGGYQLRNFTTFINTPSIVTIEPKANETNVIFPGFIICPGAMTPSFVPTKEIPESTELKFSITCSEFTGYGTELLMDVIDDANLTKECNQYLLPEDNCFTFRPKPKEPLITNDGVNDGYFKPNKTHLLFNIQPKAPIDEDLPSSADMPPFYTIYFDEYEYNGKNFSSRVPYSEPPSEQAGTSFLQFNMFPVATGQRTILEYSVIIHRYFSTIIMGQFNPRPDKLSMEIKASTKMIPRRPDPNGLPGTQFVVVPEIPYNREEMEIYEFQFISIVSRLGGFYGAITALYFMFFGMPKIEPWGLFQKVVFRCWPCRRSFKRTLADRYVSAAGIPLGEDIDDRPEGASLEDRLQILEYLLKDCYLDSYYLDKLKLTKLRYDQNEKKYKELEALVEVKAKAIKFSRKAEREDESYRECVERWKHWSRTYGPRNDSSNDSLGTIPFDPETIPLTPRHLRNVSDSSNQEPFSYYSSHDTLVETDEIHIVVEKC